MVPPNQARDTTPPAPPDASVEVSPTEPVEPVSVTQATWVKVDITLEINGRITAYTLEGHPAGALPHVLFTPDFDAPNGVLNGMALTIDCRLDEHTLIVSNEEAPQIPPLLRVVGE